MTDEAPKEEVLTGPHNAETEVAQEQQAAEEAEVEEISQAIDVASDLVSWTKTPAGKDTMERLQNEARKAMNELFAVLHENPELGRIIAVVARFEAASKTWAQWPQRTQPWAAASWAPVMRKTV